MARKPWALLGALALCAAINLALRWPGELNPDSRTQLKQAIAGHFVDWHPPIMAVVWRLLLHVGSGPAPMLVLIVGLHWCGIGLFADFLRRRGHDKAALVMVLSGFSPIAIKYTGLIAKDGFLASFLLFAFGLTTLHGRAPKVLAAVSGLIGTLARHNGIFALPPLAFAAARKRLSVPKTVAVCLVGSVLLIPLGSWINYGLLRTERTGIERALQLYDIFGVAYYSGDTSLMPVQVPDLKRCYTPLFWDTIDTPRCGLAAKRVTSSVSGLWLKSIARHPMAYATHRLMHFNREIFFLVPPAVQCVDAPEMHDCPVSLRADLIQKNALLWPCSWLALGLVMLLSRELVGVPFALCLSAVLYGLGYLVVGVAMNFRYFYWTELAIQTALIVQVATVGFPRWRIAAGVVLLVWLLGYAWRFTHIAA